MFYDRQSGCERLQEVDVATRAGQRLQPIRLTPIQGGAWCLPAFHADIPVAIRAAEIGVAEKAYAGFALQAHADGVCLPGGRFTTISEAIKKQWHGWIQDSLKDHVSPLNMCMLIHGTDETITVTISVPGNLEILKMKPLVEALNDAHPGLGWWAAELAHNAKRDNYPIYTLEGIADFFCSDNSTDFTDKDFAEALNEREGEKKSFEERRASHDGHWPSDLIEAADGHSWLFRQRRYVEKTKKSIAIGKKPRIATNDDAKAFLSRKDLDHSLIAPVQAFLALNEELSRKDSNLVGCSNGEESDYEPEKLGASCLLVWNDSDLPFEVIGHYEKYLQDTGEYSEVDIAFSADALSEQDLAKLTQSIKDFVARHCAISKAFSFFEVKQ